MRCLLFAAVVFALVPLAGHAEEQQHVAVLEFELAPAVKNLDRTYLSDRARSALRDAMPGLFIMTRESTETLLQANGKTISDCVGECEVEVGRKLGADLIVGGRVAKFGTRTSVTMRLFSTADGRLVSSAEARGESLDQLQDALDGALLKLVDPLVAKSKSARPANAAPESQQGLSPLQMKLSADSPRPVEGPGQEHQLDRSDNKQSEVNGAGIFEDRGTTLFQRSAKLEWQKQPSGDETSWEGATEACRSLSLAGTGWRLPSKEELERIYQGKSSEGSSFPGGYVWFWSSSPFSGPGGIHWDFNFHLPTAKLRANFDLPTIRHSVLCVR
jgi:TolB-like protein